MAHLQAEGIACVAVQMTDLVEDGMTVDQWYAGIINSIVMDLHLKDQFDDAQWWDKFSRLSAVQRFTKFIEEVLLEQVAEQIVIFIDEIDRILSLPFSLDGFFAALRECYNKRADHPSYKRLTFALIGVATPSDLIQDKRSTPFNIGRAIELTGFTFTEALPLAAGLSTIATNPTAVLQEILHWTGGQPFLTQKLLQRVQAFATNITPGVEAEAVGAIAKKYIINQWESQDEPEHLRTIRDRLTLDNQHQGQSLGLYQQVLQQGSIIANSNLEQMKLRLTGLVVKQQDNIKVYNKIYEAVFDQDWIDQRLHEMRPPEYAQAIDIWLKSKCTDKAHLLTGQALQKAIAWAEDKKLGQDDYQFLSVSQQESLARATQENQNLEAANRKAKQVIVVAWITVISAGMATMLAIRESSEAQQGVRSAHKEIVTLGQQIQNLKNNVSQLGDQRTSLEMGLKSSRDRLTLTEKERNETKDENIRLNAKSQFTLGQLGIATQRYNQITQSYNQVIKKQQIAQDNIEDIWKIARAFSFVAQRKYSEAIEAYRSVLRDNPRNSFALIGRGLVYAENSQFQLALNDFSNAINVNSCDQNAYYYRGNSHISLGNFQVAAVDFSKAIHLDPRFSAAYNSRGIARAYSGDTRGAIDDFSQAIRLDSKLAAAYNNRGIIRQNLGRYEDAMADLEQTIRLEINNIYALNNRELMRTRPKQNFSFIETVYVRPDERLFTDFTAVIRTSGRERVEVYDVPNRIRVGYIRNGSRVFFTGREESVEKIQWAELIGGGWIQKRFFTRIPSESEDRRPSLANQFAFVSTSSGVGVNVRDRPGGIEVGGIDDGTRVSLTGSQELAYGFWWAELTGGGWVATDFLQFTPAGERINRLMMAVPSEEPYTVIINGYSKLLLDQVNALLQDEYILRQEIDHINIHSFKELYKAVSLANRLRENNFDARIMVRISRFDRGTLWQNDQRVVTSC